MLIYSLKNCPDFFSAGACRGSALQPDLGGAVPSRGSNHRRWRKGAFSHVWPGVRLEVESHLTSAGAVTYDTYELMTLKYAEYQYIPSPKKPHICSTLMKRLSFEHIS